MERKTAKPRRGIFRAKADEKQLLQALRCGIVADQVFEDCEDVAAVAYDALQQGAEGRFVARLAVPLGQDGRGHLYIAPQFFRRVPAQEGAIEKGGLSLRELEVLQLLI
jgi:hypothetical protein